MKKTRGSTYSQGKPTLRLKDKYGNDECNRQKAADLAKYRKNKKTEV
jgi:hypothetical protein